jgi:hypothetical protein
MAASSHKESSRFDHDISLVYRVIVESSYLNAFFRRGFDGREQTVKLWIKGHRKGRINYTTIHLSTKIDFHDITVLEHSLITGVGRVMRGDVVNRAPCGEANTTLHI